MNCPDCGSKGTPLTHHHFLHDAFECGNPACRRIYEASAETADLQRASAQLDRPSAPPHSERTAPSPGTA